MCWSAPEDIAYTHGRHARTHPPKAGPIGAHRPRDLLKLPLRGQPCCLQAWQSEMPLLFLSLLICMTKYDALCHAEKKIKLIYFLPLKNSRCLNPPPKSSWEKRSSSPALALRQTFLF